MKIFECEWLKMKEEHDRVSFFFISPLFNQQTSTSDLVNLVTNNNIFGAVECDLNVPETWYFTICLFFRILSNI